MHWPGRNCFDQGSTIHAAFIQSFDLSFILAFLLARIALAILSTYSQEFDLVLLCVKAHSTVAALAAITPLLKPQTILLTIQNGLPWWWLRGHPQYDKFILHSVEPGGAISEAIPLSHCIGGVAYIAATASALPGEVTHARSARECLIIGEPSNEITPRLKALEAVLQKTSLPIKLTASIRDDMVRQLAAVFDGGLNRSKFFSDSLARVSW